MSETIYGIFLLLGGIGLFLYGINFTSKSLEDAAGDKLSKILEKATSKGVYAFVIGIAVTALIQSSGAASVLTVGFVSSGFMELTKALYVMLGANIGTTVTSQIIAFKIDSIAPLILFVGAALLLFVKKRVVKKTGSIILGFGLLFVGILIMNTAVDKLPIDTIIADFLSAFGNPFVCFGLGVLVTALIQSSSASIGILQVLVSTSAVASGIALRDVMYIIIGMNVGAVMPVILVSFNANRRSKRTAAASVISKLLGTALFTVLLLIFPGIVDLIIRISSPENVSRQIANFHLAFNLIANFAVLPLCKPICRLVTKLMPDDEKEEYTSKKLIYISQNSLINPAVAIKQVKQEVMRMAYITRDNIKLSLESFFEVDVDKAERVLEVEKTINYLNHEITGFLVQLHGKALFDADIAEAGIMLRVVADIERIGDHAENIAEYTAELKNSEANLSEEGLAELRTIAERSMQTLDLSIEVYEKREFDKLGDVSELEEDVDAMQEQFIENHISRLKSEKCDPRGGVIFTDMITDLERCSDHAINIAYAINGEKSTVTLKKAYVVTRDLNE
ncbi:MAG: Na/Pi cotransporter family protein [Clostridia bacterium]|nr:Na/Pi cotransporter family protein [Clostridia bacterium]